MEWSQFQESAQQSRRISTGTHDLSVQELRPPFETPSFEEIVSNAIASAPANVDVGVLAINVDYFDVVIASHGVEIGREVMRSTAQRIRSLIAPGDAIARCSEDGYALMCAPATTAADIRSMAARIAAQFDDPIITAAGQLAITTSVGIASAPGQTTDAAMLLYQAKSAAASAQRNGRGQVAVFDDAIRRQILESHALEQQLRSALDNRQVGVSYEPAVSLHSGEVVGIEALAQWQHETFGEVNAPTFIAIAEQSGLIYRLGRSVLGQAMAQGQGWMQDHGSVGISANLSNRQLRDPELIPMMERLLSESQLSPRNFYLEISESIVMSDVAASMTILGRLKDLGLRLAIDDFGTGHSSLSYLHRLPVDVLKIDQSFAQGIYRRDDRVITKAIIDLAHTLGMTTVAQGVETHLQAEVLHALDCDMAQGSYFHPPTSADQVDFSPINLEISEFSESPGSTSAPEEITPLFARR